MAQNVLTRKCVRKSTPLLGGVCINILVWLHNMCTKHLAKPRAVHEIEKHWLTLWICLDVKNGKILACVKTVRTQKIMKHISLESIADKYRNLQYMVCVVECMDGYT